MDTESRIALASWCKHRHSLPNSSIARLLKVDVSSVSRYLSQAEKLGWVVPRYDLKLPAQLEEVAQNFTRDIPLEERLYKSLQETCDASGNPLKLRSEGLVVVKSARFALESTKKAKVSPLDLIAIEGARILVDLLNVHKKEMTTLGIAWGRSTHRVVSSLKDHYPDFRSENVQIVPLQGGMGLPSAQADNAEFYPDILGQQLQGILKSAKSPLRLCLPAFIKNQGEMDVSDEGLRAIIQFVTNDSSYKSVSKAYESLDLGLVGIGGLEENNWALESGYLSSESEVQELKNAHVCGDIVCRFFRDAVEDPEEPSEGFAPQVRDDQSLLFRTNRRAIGISLQRLRDRVEHNARIIAVAGGGAGAKASAIHAAILNGYITDCVTDEITASRILKLCSK
jgi:DNA-binding transcriptional regulator LsrR (DeoR family)